MLVSFDNHLNIVAKVFLAEYDAIKCTPNFDNVEYCNLFLSALINILPFDKSDEEIEKELMDGYDFMALKDENTNSILIKAIRKTGVISAYSHGQINLEEVIDIMTEIQNTYGAIGSGEQDTDSFNEFGNEMVDVNSLGSTIDPDSEPAKYIMIADKLDDILNFLKTFNLPKELEPVQVYKDFASDTYIWFLNVEDYDTEKKLLPLQVDEFFTIKDISDVNDEYITEFIWTLQKINTLGVLNNVVK